MPSASANPSAQPAPSITGYIDAVAGNQVFGWAWDSRHASARLEIEVWIGERRVATAIADQGRSDLKGNGVGDGHHAFKATMPEAPKSDEVANIRVVARVPGSAESVTLKRRDEGDIAAEATIGHSLSRTLERIEDLSASQRQFHVATLSALKNLAERAQGAAASVAPAPRGIEAALAEIRESQQALEKQMSGMEVFFVRFDKTLRDLDEKLTAGTPGEAERGMRRIVVALSIGLATTLVITAAILFGGLRF
jgi:hypothetical protein